MNNNKHVSTFTIPKTIIFSLTPLVLLLVLVELTARLLTHEQSYTNTKYGHVVPDNKLIWRLKPFSDGHLKTNSLGFRDNEPRTDDAFRILLLGDSISWGDGIDDINKIYPQILEKKINKNTTGTPVDIINTGTPGYSTFQEAIVLNKYAKSLSIDMVILQFCLNDVVERYKSLAGYGGDNIFLGINTADYIPGINGFLIKYSTAYKYVYKKLIQNARYAQQAEVKSLTLPPTPFIASAWEKVFKEILGIKKFSIENNLPLIVIIAPYKFQLKDPEKNNLPQQTLIGFLRENNIDHIDLLPGLSEILERYPEIQLFKDANHFTQDGHMITAALLYQYINPVISTHNHQ